MVQLLIENNRFHAAVNRIYYGMFYSLLALSLKYRFETSKHSQLLGWFNKNIVREKIVDEKFGVIVNKAFNRRIKADYDTYVKFERKALDEMFSEMKDFINEIKRILN